MLKVLAILIVTVEGITVVLMVQDWLEPFTVVLRVGHWRRHSPMMVTAATTVSVVATRAAGPQGDLRGGPDRCSSHGVV